MLAKTLALAALALLATIPPAAAFHGAADEAFAIADRAAEAPDLLLEPAVCIQVWPWSVACQVTGRATAAPDVVVWVLFG